MAARGVCGDSMGYGWKCGTTIVFVLSNHVSSNKGKLIRGATEYHQSLCINIVIVGLDLIEDAGQSIFIGV